MGLAKQILLVSVCLWYYLSEEQFLVMQVQLVLGLLESNIGMTGTNIFKCICKYLAHTYPKINKKEFGYHFFFWAKAFGCFKEQ